MARPTARTSVWRSESQTNTALIASESTVRTRSFRDRIGAPRVARRGGGGLLFVVLLAPLRLRFGRAPGAVGGGGTTRPVGRPAGRRAARGGGGVPPRAHPLPAAWATREERLVRWPP